MGCKTHLLSEEKQGVCPLCLREKLSQLIHINNESSHHSLLKVINKSSSCNLASTISSTSSSSGHASSSLHRGNQRKGSELVMGSLSFRVRGSGSTNKHGLKKSKSIASVTTRNNIGDGKKKTKKMKKNDGFWSKLLHLKGKNHKENNLMHQVHPLRPRLC